MCEKCKETGLRKKMSGNFSGGKGKAKALVAKGQKTAWRDVNIRADGIVSWSSPSRDVVLSASLHNHAAGMPEVTMKWTDVVHSSCFNPELSRR